MALRQMQDRWSKLAVRPLAIVVFAVLALVTLFTFSMIRRIGDQQDERLLDEKTSEAALFLEATLSDIGSVFPVLTGILQVAPEPASAFELTARSFVNEGVPVVGMAQLVDGSYEVTSVAGQPPEGEAAAGQEWTALLARAASEEAMVTGVISAVEGELTRVGFASPSAASEVPVVLFLELLVDPTATLELEGDSPFGDLGGALFVGNEPEPTHLVLKTREDVEINEDSVRETVRVGADDWLLVTSREGSLVGPLADQTSWGVLIGGFVAALLAAAMVQVLSQRRAYAMRLVDERTAELTQAREVAEDANRSKSEFLSRMSHELRTPLNAVLGFGQLLEIEPLEPEQQDSVAHILKGGRHLLDLINEVLDISRIEAGELALSPEAVFVPELLQEAVDLIRPLADQSGIQLVVDQSGVCDGYVFADRQRSKQVLLNLLSNAVKYNRARGTVAVSCEQTSETSTRLRVSDTGPGIPAERLGQLFTAFERLGAEHTDIEGTGVGLALSKRLAEAMGGRLDVGTKVGKGSTFILELPQVEGPVERFERLNGAASPAQVGPESERRHVVLHIEDNLSNLKLVERVFAQRSGVEVVAAMQGRLGLELAREHRPVLVLLDLHLPDMNGEQVLQRLRLDPVTASIPVVMVSADATPGQIQRLLTAGASNYLTKPINVRELLTVLDEALAS